MRKRFKVDFSAFSGRAHTNFAVVLMFHVHECNVFLAKGRGAGLHMQCSSLAHCLAGNLLDRSLMLVIAHDVTLNPHVVVFWAFLSGLYWVVFQVFCTIPFPPV